ncbi:MAG: PAS domain S-box protein [Deltaproteobacteria bacterium]|nr:MAG: PAS domain S-box protein [Deltaproteobacteria bacterium]
MESNNSLELRLKKVTQELSSHRIELHQTRGYLQCILQNSNDMIFATDVDGMIVSFSKGGEKVLGYTWEEVAGYYIETFSEDPQLFEKFMADSHEKGSAVRLEFPFKHKQGHTVYCDVSMINLTNTKGQRVGTVGVSRDITRWKKLQDELIRIDRLAEIGRVAAGIAHEINNPLAVINEITGWAEETVQEAKGLSPEDREELEKAVQQIAEQTRRCRSITHQLLGFVREAAPERTEFDVNELLNATIDFVGPELKYAPIEVVRHFSKEPLSMKSDPAMMEQVFVNLLTNAIHAIDEKGRDQGRIEIKTVKRDSEAEISIADNGIGITKENQGKVFNLFFTTKPPGKGTGLGLSICQNILKTLNGGLSFHSEPGVGTTFTVRVPLS